MTKMEEDRDMRNIQNWNIRKLSQEFKQLPEGVKQKIESHLLDYPVRLGDLANSLGITVLLSTLPRGISGQIGEEDGKFVIRINRHEAKNRQRFTLAHEISHFLLHKKKIIKAGGWSENVLLRSGKEPLEVEYEANRLASDIIIPSALLEKAIEKYSLPITSEVIEDLACRFRVSVAAMEIKLQVI